MDDEIENSNEKNKVKKTVTEILEQTERNNGCGMFHMLYLDCFSTEDLEKECHRIENIWNTGICIMNCDFWFRFSILFDNFANVQAERITEEKYLKTVKYHVWFGDLKKSHPIDYLSHKDIELLWRYAWFKDTIKERTGEI